MCVSIIRFSTKMGILYGYACIKSSLLIYLVVAYFV